MTFQERFKDLEITQIIVNDDGSAQIEGNLLNGDRAWVLVRIAQDATIRISTLESED